MSIENYKRSKRIVSSLEESLHLYRNGAWSYRLDLSVRYCRIERSIKDYAIAHITIPGYFSDIDEHVYRLFMEELSKFGEQALEKAIDSAKIRAEKARIEAKTEALSVLEETSK